jgi:predicted transcriptional regulator
MSLRALRDSVRKTQGELARATAMSQPQLSRFEGRRDHLISTLRRYVRALGGEIEVVALISGRRIPLRDV